MAMSEAHREFLRKNREYIKRNLEVDAVWPQMTDVLDRNCEDKIRAESTPEARTLELLNLLHRRGDEAFISFIRATLKVQRWVGEHLADLAGLNVNHILQNATQRETEEPGMKEVHRRILVSHLSTFKQSLNVAEMVESLSNNVAITSRNPGVNIRAVLQELSLDKKVEKLICDVLPRLGPDAFQCFFKTLDKNQPQLAHDLRQSIKATHSGELIDERQCYMESTNAHLTGQTTAQFNLETTCSDLPDHVQRKLEERLNKGNELLENDWRSLYKAVNLPQGKENIIAEKFSGNPTRYVLDTWFDRDGQHANVRALLLALKECKQGGLAHEIERDLDVKLPDQVPQDTVDGIMQLNENEKRTVDDERSLGELPKTASEEKESLLYLLNDNDSDADIGITSTSGPKLLSQPWKCYDKSIMHQQMFRMMEEYGKKNPRKVKLVNGVKVICSEEFLLGKGSDGTRVYLGLGKDGYGKAVKRLLRDSCTELAEREKDILNELSAKRSNYVVNYWHLEEEPGTDYLYLILDLCEESLESFVQSSTLQYLQKALPTILMQILKGLADLHSGEHPILHRDLRPSNVLRDVQGNFLVADFGISHMLSDETSTHWSIQRGAKYWIAPESYDASDDTINKVRYKKESDIMNAGMVAYYVATKGKHPFGPERHRLDNILKGNPVGLDKIKDATLKDLLSWMLQLKPEDRPLANEALKHPYLQTDKENFDFLCDVGNEPEIKTSSPHSLPPNLRKQLNLSINWMDRIDPEFFNHFNKVSDSTWLGCLRFLRNVRQHWHDKPRPQLSSCVKGGNYQEYFLQLFEELPYLVHRAIRLSAWKARPDLEKHFPSETQK